MHVAEAGDGPAARPPARLAAALVDVARGAADALAHATAASRRTCAAWAGPTRPTGRTTSRSSPPTSLALLDELGLDRVRLMGHDWGAVAAAAHLRERARARLEGADPVGARRCGPRLRPAPARSASRTCRSSSRAVRRARRAAVAKQLLRHLGLHAPSRPSRTSSVLRQPERRAGDRRHLPDVRDAASCRPRSRARASARTCRCGSSAARATRCAAARRRWSWSAAPGTSCPRTSPTR